MPKAVFRIFCFRELATWRDLVAYESTLRHSAKSRTDTKARVHHNFTSHHSVGYRSILRISYFVLILKPPIEIGGYNIRPSLRHSSMPKAVFRIFCFRELATWRDLVAYESTLRHSAKSRTDTKARVHHNFTSHHSVGYRSILRISYFVLILKPPIEIGGYNIRPSLRLSSMPKAVFRIFCFRELATWRDLGSLRRSCPPDNKKSVWMNRLCATAQSRERIL